MSHLEEEAIASLAVGDDQDAVAALHAVDCVECAGRVDQMRALADRIGALGGHSGLLTPPDRVWEQIASELGDELLAEAGSRTLKLAEAPMATSGPLDSPARGGSGSADAGSTAEASGGPAASTPINLAAARTSREESQLNQDRNAARGARRTPWFVGIAAGLVGLVAGAGIFAGILRSTEPSGAVVAQAALTNLVTEADAGTARVEVLDDGSEVLVIDTDFEKVPDGYLEVWLIDSNVDGMVSLGHLTQASEEFVIPEGFDVAAFPIVDISIEPLDGVPTHSGASVTRGVLER